MEDIVRNQIDDRRSAYLAQGWDSFRQGRYQDALSRFRLADAVSLSLADAQAHSADMEARASVKLGLVYGGIAARQYAQAISALSWLLTPDARTGQLADAQFLNRIGDIRDLYGAEGLYEAHVQGVEQFAIANPTSVEAKALQAFALWANKRDVGAPGRALFLTRWLASEPGVEAPWTNLDPAMQRADTASRGEGKEHEVESSSSHSASSRLPFELPETE